LLDYWTHISCWPRFLRLPGALRVPFSETRVQSVCLLTFGAPLLNAKEILDLNNGNIQRFNDPGKVTELVPDPSKMFHRNILAASVAKKLHPLRWSINEAREVERST
jgi:hypothetical protein